MKSRSTPPAPDPSVVTAGAILRHPEGWYEALVDLRKSVEANHKLEAFNALRAIRCVVDGLLYMNQTLRGTSTMGLPAGARLVPYAPPPAPNVSKIDVLAGRRPDDLVPIPLWAAAALAQVCAEAIAGADTFTMSEPRRAAPSIDLNKLFGVAGEGRGNRGLLHRAETLIQSRKMAAAVWEMRRQPDPPTLDYAFDEVAHAFNREASIVRRAWTKHQKWVEKQMATVPPSSSTPTA